MPVVLLQPPWPELELYVSMLALARAVLARIRRGVARADLELLYEIQVGAQEWG